MAYKIYKGSTEIKKLYAPLNIGFNVSSNYAKVGSPTISNNVASGFSSSNYLTLSKPITIGNSNYEIIIKFQTGSQTSTYQVLYYQGVNVLSFALHNLNSGFQLHSNTGNGTKWNTGLNGTTEIPVGTIGFAKFVRKNGVRSQYLSYDGIKWTNEGSIADTNDIAGGKGFIGRASLEVSDIQVNNGSIYLAESTFNINGAANIKKVYKGSTLIYNAFEAPKIDQPTFTSNTTNGITVSIQSGADDAYVLFNGTNSHYYMGRSWVDNWAQIKYPEQVVLDKYAVTTDNYGSYPNKPYEWYLQGSNNGTSWTNIHHITDQTYQGKGVRTEYPVDMPEDTKYYYYRLLFKDGKIWNNAGELNRLQFYTKAVG